MKAATVIVIGAGGHGRVLLDALAQQRIVVAGVVDADALKHSSNFCGVQVLGDDSALERYSSETTRLVNAIGSTASMNARQAVFERLRGRGFRFMSIVHPSAVVAPDAVLGEGVQVMAGGIVQPGARIGDNSIVNTGAQVDHDCEIGRHVHLAPGAILSGDVRVGDAAHVGSGAVVIQGVRVGAGCLIAAGAVVTQDVAPGERVAGVPARRMRK